MNPGEGFYERTMSCLAALRMLNARSGLLNVLVAGAWRSCPSARSHLVDFVRWAIVRRRRLYDTGLASQEVQYIRTHMARGFVPAGAELEFSNIGHAVIRDPAGRTVRDAQYDGFFYFSDFGLDVLTWKLGGHVDDHHEKVSARPRRGFFELALGSLSLEANLSKPVTDDPWLLNQLIHQTRMFFPIAPAQRAHLAPAPQPTDIPTRTACCRWA